MATFNHTMPLQEFKPSPLKKIPTELSHELFTHFDPAEVANMRLVSRNLADVGAEFILPKARLMAKKDSFDRLLAISEHPVIHKYVEILGYTADLLYDLDFEAWKKCFPDSDWTTALAGMEKPPTSANHYFQKYEEYVREQQRVLSGEYAATLAIAIKNLPALKTVLIGYREPWFRSKQSQTAFADALADKGHFLSNEATAGDLNCVPQMVYLLLGLAEAGTKIEDLMCRTVSWRILECEESILAKIRMSLSSLKTLDIGFATGTGDDYDESEPIACREHLRRTGALVTLVTAAPLLTSLDLTFWNDQTRNSIDIQDIVGNFAWPFLNHFHFYQIKASEDNFVAFCSRHPGVKAISLQRIELTTGTWSSTLQRMRRCLPVIETVRLNEWFTELETDSELDLDEPSKLKHPHADALDAGNDIEGFFRVPVEDEVSFDTFMAAPYYEPEKLYPNWIWAKGATEVVHEDIKEDVEAAVAGAEE